MERLEQWKLLQPFLFPSKNPTNLLLKVPNRVFMPLRLNIFSLINKQFSLKGRKKPVF